MSGSGVPGAADAILSSARRHLGPFTRAQLRCEPRAGGYRLTFAGDRARVRRDLHLVVHHYFQAAADGPRTTGYAYALEDDAGHEILAYHWHAHMAPAEPHLHLGHGARVGREDLARAHVPTGPVGLPELARLLRELTERGPGA